MFLIFVGAIALLVFFMYTAFSVEKIFLLLAFYVSAFPMLSYLGNFPGIPIGFTWYIGIPLFVLLCTYWFIHLSSNREHVVLNQMDIAVIIYLAVMFLAAINGFFKDYDRKVLMYDFMPALFFLGYFIFLYSPLKDRIKRYYDVLLISAVFVSLQFIYALTHYKSFVVLARIVSEHIHIAQFALPYILLTLIYSTSRRRRLLGALCLPLIVLGVILCQQRSLYMTMVLTLLMLAGVFLYSRRAWIKTHLARSFMYIALAIFMITIFFVLLQTVTGGKFLLTLYSRAFIFLNLSRLSADLSWRIRWGEIRSALEGLQHFWLFGKGFGAWQITRFRYVRQIVLDQSYMYYIWKTGFIGLASVLYMHFIFFKRGMSALRKNLTKDDKIIVISALLNTAGMMLIAFANVSIGHFRLMFVWAGIFACTELIARKYD
jgi:hypothetical protein